MTDKPNLSILIEETSSYREIKGGAYSWHDCSLSLMATAPIEAEPELYLGPIGIRLAKVVTL